MKLSIAKLCALEFHSKELYGIEGCISRIFALNDEKFTEIYKKERKQWERVVRLAIRVNKNRTIK